MTATVSAMHTLCRGFTLIELMVSIAILGLLTVLAVPMYSAFVVNTHIRTATESLLSGVRYAQTEAVKRNATVDFVLDEAVGWTVYLLDTSVAPAVEAAKLRGAAFTDGSAKSLVKPTGASRRITFNGLGRVQTKNPVDDTAPLARVDVTIDPSLSFSSPRNLRLVVGVGGIKVCDPALASSDPAGCP